MTVHTLYLAVSLNTPKGLTFINVVYSLCSATAGLLASGWRNVVQNCGSYSGGSLPKIGGELDQSWLLPLLMHVHSTIQYD